MKFKFSTFFAALIAIFAFSAINFAQDAKTNTETMQERGGKRHGKMGGGKHGEGRHGGGKMLLRLASELNLTDAQKQQITTITENNKTATQAQRQELKNIWSQKRDGTALSTEQENRARELSSQLREAGKKMHDEMLAVLTTEQQTQLKQKQEEMRQKMQERRRNKRNGETPTQPQS